MTLSNLYKRSLVALAVALPAIIGCSSNADGNGTSSNGSTLNDGIGTICSNDSGCAKGQTCRSDTTDWVAHHQCTAACSKDDDCASAFGDHTMCIGANICVSKCLDNSNCPAGTICNEFGWCGNTGPGSGVPVCSGTPTSCASIVGESDCVTALGCSWNGDCGGIANECFTFFDDYSCSSQSGCFWSSTSSTCSGSSTSCRLSGGQFSCASQKGCRWSGKCSGVQSETSCQKISASLCKFTPGCSLVPQ